MIDLKERPDVAWDVLLGLALVGIVVAVWFGFVQKPPAAGAAVSPTSTLKLANRDIQRAEAAASGAESDVERRTWDETPEVFGSMVLDKLTGMAEKSHLLLAGFHVGKPILASSLKEAPFVVNLEGGFMDVMDFVKKIEQADSKLAITQLQITSGNGTDHVNATLALTGFLRGGK